MMTEQFRAWVVCDGRGFRSVDGDGENETFPAFRAAEERAKELAAETPGQTVLICEVTAACVCPVSPPDVTRKYPVEHYR